MIGRMAMAALVAALMTGPGRAETPGSPDYIAAQQAVRAFREQTYLPTQCETAFTRFWSLFRAGDDEALVYDHTPWGRRSYFGYGNPRSEPLLAEASEVCQMQSGHRGDMIVRVLRDRERKKEWRHDRARHAERLIKGF